MPDVTREAKLRAALIRALEQVPEQAHIGDAALVVAKVVRSLMWDEAVPVLELAVRALRVLELDEARTADERRKG